ncbi:MAG TPA: Ig-like domain repeat protein [Terriglobales bacterium]|nr:Ig-like domain repeat protein [Terriglobales bacterium]
MQGARQNAFFVAICLFGLAITSRAQEFYATSETTGQLELINLQAKTMTTVYTAAGKPDSILINAKKQLIYDLSPQGILAMYDPATQTNTVLLTNLKSPRDLLFDVPTACNPNANANTMLVAEYGIGQIIRYDFTTGTAVNLGAQLGSAANSFSVDGLAYDAQGELFAVASHNTVVQLDPCTGDVLKTLVLEPHYKVDGGDGMVYDPYSGQLWVSHDGSNNANGLIEVPTDLSSFSLFQSGEIPVPDGIVSDGKGNLYIGAGLLRLVVYNIPSDTLAQSSPNSLLVPGIDSLALIAGTSTSTGLSASPNPSIAGESVTLTATITPTPTGTPFGTVSFYNGSTLLNTATVNSSGVATFATTSLPPGADNIKATYSGNIDFAASAAPAFTETVTGTSLTATSTAITASPSSPVVSQSVILTATVTPAPIGAPLGTVDFFNDSTLLNTATVNSSGVATFTTTTLPAGSDSLTAAYSGNAGFTASTSTALKLTVGTAPAFAVTAPTTPVTVAASGSANVNITVSAVGGTYNGTVTLSATGLPAGATATFSPATVVPGNSSSPATMTIQTSTQTANTPANRKSELPFTAMFVSAGLCMICSKHRRIARSLPMILAIATLAFGTLSLAGCGGGTTMSTGTGQQSKSYVITVTGTSPSTPDATTTFTLVVQ